MDCDTARRTVLLALYGEVREAERDAGRAHLDGCAACRLAEAEERRLHAILAERDAAEPSDDLLALARRDLGRALDAEPGPRVSFLRKITGFWMEARLSPAYGLALVATGFLAGVTALRILPALGGSATGPAPVAAAIPGAAASNVVALESAPDQDHVRVSFDTSQRSQIEGSAADPAIRSLLVATLRDSINAGLRLEAIDALGPQAHDGEVRAALIQALRDDRNPGARLRAIDALRERLTADPEVRAAMLEALESDANPGVRVRAIDFLARARDPRILPVMERLSQEDPDTYIRMRSADIAEALYAEARR